MEPEEHFTEISKRDFFDERPIRPSKDYAQD